jgi:hypothetical protein
MGRRGGSEAHGTMSQTETTTQIASLTCGGHQTLKTIFNSMIGDAIIAPDLIIANPLRRKNGASQ